jgi:drug/metabolite transporter (DMT)-like permease
MSWVLASLLSAFLLGIYQLCTKHAVQQNAVLPVLFWSNVCSAAVWLALLGAQGALPTGFHVASLGWREHLLLLAKSALVASSWVCSYFAVKHLPVSLTAPIRATGPMWTLFGALLVLGERPSWMEFLGVGVTLASFVGLSFAGAKEGVHFHRDRWVGWLIAGTLLGAVSGLYDKYLLGTRGFDAATVQCWFSIYLALLFLPLAIGWWLRLWARKEFHWRWSIVGVSFALLAADFLYFDALREPEALVSLVSSLRRGSTLVAFAGGLWLFREKNGLQKLPAVLGIVTGMTLTILG